LEARRAGVGQYAYHLTRALLERPTAADRQYLMFSYSWKLPWPRGLPSESAAVKYRQLVMPSRAANLAIALSGRPRLEDLVSDFDVAWLPNLSFAASRRPYAVTAHDLSFVRYPEFFSAKQRLWHAAIRPARLLKQAARIIAVSEHTKLDLMETYGLPDERIEIIYPAAGPEYRPASDQAIAEVRAKYRLPERFFLYLGTIEPRKNIDGLIAAFEQQPIETDLVIAGGRGWLWRGVFRRAARSSARRRIRFLDYVAEEDKPALYSSALALTYPSFYEGFGMPPLEAMACGLPVIASHASSLGEVVGQAGLLVDPHDLNELAETMRAVAEQPALRTRLRQRGLTQAKQFTWEESGARLDRLIEEMA
jgi:glycosyltransferase involved in cell wall biosynthesis